MLADQRGIDIENAYRKKFSRSRQSKLWVAGWLISFLIALPKTIVAHSTPGEKRNDANSLDQHGYHTMDDREKIEDLSVSSFIQANSD